jgi:hypothetical protein
MSWVLVVALAIVCYIAVEVSRRVEQPRLAEAEFRKLLMELADEPGSAYLQEAFPAKIRQAKFNSISTQLSEEAYRVALDHVSKHPSSGSAKTFAREVGRWHFAHLRANKAATPLDDRVIQEQILKRCGMILDRGPVGWVE